MKHTSTRYSICSALLLSLSVLLVTACGGTAGSRTVGDQDADSSDVADANDPADPADNTDNTTTDGDVTAEEEVETESATEQELIALDAWGKCNTADDCSDITVCRRDNATISNCVCQDNICTANPDLAGELYWEDWEFDYEEYEKTGEFKPLGTPIDMTCAETPFTETSGETTKVNIDGRIKVFGLKARCQVLNTYVFLQWNGDKLVDASNNANAVATGEAPGEAELETGQCPVVIKNVPTDKWLVLKSADGDSLFKDTYQYNVFIPSSAIHDINGEKWFSMDVNAISSTSYNIVPTMAGITGGIAATKGAVAGTIRDCKGDLIKNGTVGFTGEYGQLSYFNADVHDLLPQRNTYVTNSDGTFMSLNHPEGEWEAVTIFRKDGSLYSSRKMQFKLSRNSVTMLLFRINNPMNLPEVQYEAETTKR